MKYEWKAGGYEKVSATPPASGLSGSALAYADPKKVKRIGASAQAWQAVTTATVQSTFAVSPPQDFSPSL